jgi:hypothetical protein
MPSTEWRGCIWGLLLAYNMVWMPAYVDCLAKQQVGCDSAWHRPIDAAAYRRRLPSFTLGLSDELSRLCLHVALAKDVRREGGQCHGTEIPRTEAAANTGLLLRTTLRGRPWSWEDTHVQGKRYTLRVWGEKEPRVPC